MGGTRQNEERARSPLQIEFLYTPLLHNALFSVCLAAKISRWESVEKIVRKTRKFSLATQESLSKLFALYKDGVATPPNIQKHKRLVTSRPLLLNI